MAAALSLKRYLELHAWQFVQGVVHAFTDYRPRDLVVALRGGFHGVTRQVVEGDDVTQHADRLVERTKSAAEINKFCFRIYPCISRSHTEDTPLLSTFQFGTKAIQNDPHMRCTLNFWDHFGGLKGASSARVILIVWPSLQDSETIRNTNKRQVTTNTNEKQNKVRDYYQKLSCTTSKRWQVRVSALLGSLSRFLNPCWHPHTFFFSLQFFFTGIVSRKHLQREIDNSYKQGMAKEILEAKLFQV